MRWSEIHLKTLREKPAGAETPGHVLLLRGGYIFPISAGLFVYNSLLLRSLLKFTAIVREELEKEGAREIFNAFGSTKRALGEDRSLGSF